MIKIFLPVVLLISACNKPIEHPSYIRINHNCLLSRIHFLTNVEKNQQLPIAIMSKHCMACHAMRTSLENIKHIEVDIDQIDRKSRPSEICGINQVPALVLPSGRVLIGYENKKNIEHWINYDEQRKNIKPIASD